MNPVHKGEGWFWAKSTVHVFFKTFFLQLGQKLNPKPIKHNKQWLWCIIVHYGLPLNYLLKNWGKNMVHSNKGGGGGFHIQWTESIEMFFFPFLLLPLLQWFVYQIPQNFHP